jgi:hypothetical protein
MIIIKHRGTLRNTERFLKGASRLNLRQILEKYAQEGVHALASATPVDSGLTSNSWGYDINIRKGLYTIFWMNTNVVNGVPIAIILQYGHGTGTGGYVQGRNYINPAIQPIFDKIANEVWREVMNL